MQIDSRKLKEYLLNCTLLYVEDEVALCELTAKMFERMFKSVDTAHNGVEALELYKQKSYDVVITDIAMPKLNGLDMSKKILEINPEQIIVITSAYSDSKKLLESISLGLDGYLIKPIDMQQMYATLIKIGASLQNKKENEYYKKNLEGIIEKKVLENSLLQEEKFKNYEDTILALVNMVEIRDSYTSGHSLRVAKYSEMILKEFGAEEKELDTIYQAGILHDIGKIAIPDSILLKPNALTGFEFSLMKKHAIMSYEILNQIPMYKDLSIYVKHHHERFNGSGYPDGLKGDEIPLYSQIMAIADTFDAMTTSRIYKPRKNKEDAIEELKTLSNISFSKQLVDVATKVLLDVEINIEVNQNPITEFEEQRFSFFYKDKLTGLYNSDYLDLVLNKNSQKFENRYMTIVLLRNFNQFNKENSWEKGDSLLVTFAEYLKTVYKEGTKIFRFRGDDFLVLNNESFSKIKEDFLEDFNIPIEVVNIDLEANPISGYSKLNDYIDLNH